MPLIIPAYRPDEKLLVLLAALRAETKEPILLVDDGSGEAYRPIFDRAAAYQVVLLVHPQNRGKGAALKTAFRYLKEQPLPGAIVCADADGQHLPKDILRCLEAANNRPGTLVIGGRAFKGSVPLRSRFGNACSRLTFRLLMGQKVRDTQTGLRAFTPDLLDFMLTVPGDRYEYEMQMLCRAAKNKIPLFEIEIETVYLEENASSHFSPLRDSLRVYAILLGNAAGRLFQIISFSLSSLICFAIDLILYWAFNTFLFSLFWQDKPTIALTSLLAARLISSALNYIINRKVVFHSGTSRLKSTLLFYLTVLIIFLLDHFLNVLFWEILDWPKMVSIIAAQCLCFPLSFVIQKFLVFQNKPLHERE